MFDADEPVRYDHRDTEAQKRLVSDELADGGWEMPRLLELMHQKIAIANLRQRHRQAAAENDPAEAAETLVEAGAEEFAQLVASYAIKDY